MRNIATKPSLGNIEVHDARDAPISRLNPDQYIDQNNQRTGFARICAAIIPYLRSDGYSWNGFADFTPAAVNWLRANQAVVRADKSQFKRQRTPKQKAHEAWARLVQ